MNENTTATHRRNWPLTQMMRKNQETTFWLCFIPMLFFGLNVSLIFQNLGFAISPALIVLGLMIAGAALVPTVAVTLDLVWMALTSIGSGFIKAITATKHFFSKQFKSIQKAWPLFLEQARDKLRDAGILFLSLLTMIIPVTGALIAPAILIALGLTGLMGGLILPLVIIGGPILFALLLDPLEHMITQRNINQIKQHNLIAHTTDDHDIGIPHPVTIEKALKYTLIDSQPDNSPAYKETKELEEQPPAYPEPQAYQPEFFNTGLNAVDSPSLAMTNAS